MDTDIPPAAEAALRDLATADPQPPALDARGHDPADYQWVPVRRKPRADGWSDEKQRAFIGALADSGSVIEAAMTVGMSPRTAYALRRAPDGKGFAAAWDQAIRQAALRLVDVAFERAMVGSDEPVFNRDGERVGRRFRVSDRLLMFLLRAHFPERYRFASRDTRGADEALAPAPEPAALARAIEELEPATPPEPHKLMAPDQLADALLVADILNGGLPHWHRDPEPEARRESTLGPAFEAALDAAKRAAADPAHLPEADRLARAMRTGDGGA